jgi:hypothetical protein
MRRAASFVPADSDLLCEGCGYTLNGLTHSSNCPECGKPIEQSSDSHRQYTEFENRPSVKTFLRTTWGVLAHPSRFYRTLLTRGEESRARQFAQVHWLIAACLAAAAAQVHIRFLSGLRTPGPWDHQWFWAAMGLLLWFSLNALTHLAARLSAWEAAYRGIRLPINTVRRGLYFHAPHYLPVILIVLITVTLMRYLVYHIGLRGWTINYLIVLSAQVVGGAVYLFITYWIGMKNMMFANR